MEIAIPQAENISVNDLKVDGKNPNKMTKEQHERLATSFKKFGFIVPIITNKDLLIADGEQRWTVAKSLGMTNVSVIRLPVEEVDRRLLRQVLNKLRGEHELLLDAEEFEAIIDLGKKDDLKYLLDLNDEKLEHYLSELHPPEEENFEMPDLETVETDIKNNTILQLGAHRLMCGDAANQEQVKALLEYISPNILLTDPPYGLNVVHNKKVGASGFTKFAGKESKWINCNHYPEIINDDKPFDPKHLIGIAETTIIFGGNYFTDKLPQSSGWLIWDKKAGLEYDNTYADCEMVWTNKTGHPKIYRCLWQGIVKEGEHGKRVHPTQKPLKLLSDILKDYSQTGFKVLDLYGGSGSTLIACEQTNRVCYMMEIDSRYCEIIAQRWEKYTGQKRKLVKSGKNDIR